jgi:signal transduction histidine kinase
MKRLLAFMFAVSALTVSPAMAENRALPQQAQALLDKAAAKLNKDGPEQAFAAFNSRDGGFVAHELYVFAFDMTGRYMASGANPKLVGSDAHELKDAEGKMLVKEMIDVSKTKGKGEIDYVWLNRADNRVEKKHSIYQAVNGYILGVGYYLE